MQFLGCCFADSRHIKPNISLVEVQDLNFVLHSEIFVHYNGQLRASNLILGCTPSYTSYQAPGLAFLASNLLLTYIDVRIPGFLPNIMVNEAQRREPRWARKSSWELVKDSSGDSIFHDRLQHIPVDDLEEREKEARDEEGEEVEQREREEEEEEK